MTSFLLFSPTLVCSLSELLRKTCASSSQQDSPGFTLSMTDSIMTQCVWICNLRRGFRKSPRQWQLRQRYRALSLNKMPLFTFWFFPFFPQLDHGGWVLGIPSLSRLPTHPVRLPPPSCGVLSRSECR